MNKDVFFFGNASNTLPSLKLDYPELHFCEVRQEHGAKIVKASDTITAADAHWTDDFNIALIIKTADCMPILVSHPKFICAIHAGWRGVLNEITAQSLSALIKIFGAPDKIQIQVGPHIQQNSFEISEDLYPQFKNLAERYKVLDFSKIRQDRPHKFFIDLATLVQAQLLSCDIPAKNIQISAVDTFSTLSYHSYRRDKENTGRNLSFVARRR